MQQEDEMKTIIDSYIRAYNAFDTEGMLKDLHKDIVFQNISGGQVNLTTNGIDEFRSAAEQAKSFLKTRCQTVTNYDFEDNAASVEIDYVGELVVDIPDGPKAGETIRMKGKSEFVFQNNQIIKLTDIS